MRSQDRDMLEERLTGLAAWYLRRESYGRAEGCLDLAEEIRPAGFRRCLTHARLLVLQGEAGEAVFQLKAALELDPWDEDAYDLLAQLHEALGRPADAAEALADALICAGTLDPDAVTDYEAQLDRVLAAAGRQETRAELVKRRAERFSGLARETERAARASGADTTGVVTEELRFDPPPSMTILPSGAAVLLHGAGLFPGLTEEELEPLQGAVERADYRAGAPIFGEGDPSHDIFVVESGRVAISRSTPFGAQALAHCEAGSVFGEMNFIDGRTRSADAMAVTDCRLVRVAHQALRDVFEAEPRLALAFLREFWRGLADKVREANELMKSFFEESREPAEEGEQEARPVTAAAGGREEGVDDDEKTGVLSEQGLTGDELKRLASLAEALSFELEQPIFLERDPGDSLYIVLSGEVRISKLIPGVGEEALAILPRGGFFGEMSLLDGSPRSAAARAHAASTKVLRISKERLDELLETGGAGAIELLSILCRLLSGRLREINDKIVQWKYMSGGF